MCNVGFLVGVKVDDILRKKKNDANVRFFIGVQSHGMLEKKRTDINVGFSIGVREKYLKKGLKVSK